MRDPRFLSRSALTCAAVFGVFGAAACGSDHITECHSLPGAHAICGVQNPEDLAVVPGANALLISEFGSMDEDKPGALAWLDVATEKVTPLFPQGGVGVAPVIEEGADWGAATCPGPPGHDFNPHGIDLHKRKDGALELFVVNHAARESSTGHEAIELFELDVATQTLHWRGCVPMPADSFGNDVAALPDDGFAATHMFPKSYGATAFYYIARATLGSDTGHVWLWHPGGAVKKLAGSDGPFPNGIVATPDGRELFVNMYMANEVRRYALPSGKLLGAASITRPDNVSWSDDGTLLVASHVAGLSQMSSCQRVQEGACSAAFEIVSLDPKTLHTHVLLHREGPPMGAATVAVPVGNQLFLGSFKSGWLLRLARPAAAR